MPPKKEPQILSEKLLYDSRTTRFIGYRVKLANGNEASWEVTAPKYDIVVVVPYDTKGNVYLSKEWRIAWKRDVLMLPAGTIPKDSTEKECAYHARRELQEEIGFDCKKLEKLVTVLSAARIRARIHLYLARELVPSKKDADPDEIIEVVKMPFRKAYDLFVKGKEETTGYTVLGMMLAREKIKM